MGMDAQSILPVSSPTFSPEPPFTVALMSSWLPSQPGSHGAIYRAFHNREPPSPCLITEVPCVCMVVCVRACVHVYAHAHICVTLMGVAVPLSTMDAHTL